MNYKELEDYVAEIMDGFDGIGGTSEYYEYVTSHDGFWEDYQEVMKEICIREIIRKHLRNGRLPDHGGVRRFASIMVPTGKVDDEGNEVEKRAYVPAQQILFNKDDYPCNQVVNYHMGRVGYHAKEANRWVRQRRAVQPRYQRELPFPEFESEEVF